MPPIVVISLSEAFSPPSPSGAVTVVVVDLSVGMLALAAAIVCAAGACLARSAMARASAGRCQRAGGPRSAISAAHSLPSASPQLSSSSSASSSSTDGAPANTPSAAEKGEALVRAATATLSGSCGGLALGRSTFGDGAVPAWQRAVVAIGARCVNGPPRLVGSGFFVDSTARILCSCAHVIDDIADAHRRAPHTLDPHVYGVALGFGSPARWTHVALIRSFSPPPAPRDARNGLDLAVLQLVAPLPQEETAVTPAAAAPRPSSALSSGSGSSNSRDGTLDIPRGMNASIGPAHVRLTERSEGEDSPSRVTSRKAASTPSSSSSGSSSPCQGSASPALSTYSSTTSLPSLDSPSFLETAPPLPEVAALPLGDEASLGVGDDVVLLGYGQAGRGGPPAATNTRGVFAGACEHPITGHWLRTDALMLSGHSGGPLLNRRGEVVGWSVRSGFDKVLNGDGFYAAGLNEVRPASSLRGHVHDVLGGRPPDGAFVLPAGTFLLGAAEAREALLNALASAFAGLGGEHDGSVSTSSTQVTGQDVNVTATPVVDRAPVARYPHLPNFSWVLGSSFSATRNAPLSFLPPPPSVPGWTRMPPRRSWLRSLLASRDRYSSDGGIVEVAPQSCADSSFGSDISIDADAHGHGDSKGCLSQASRATSPASPGPVYHV